jgi:glycine cleavage system aminomethyltransferase T
MSSLDFLSPGLAADAGGFHPVARSAMERRFRDAGASFEERGGWLVPVSVPGEAEHLQHAGVADLSHLTKLDVRPAGEPVGGRGVVWYPLSPRRALCFCHAPELDAVRAQLTGRSVLDVTAAYAVLALAGPDAGTVLRRLTHLHHFPSGGAVAHVTAHVLAPAAPAGRTGPAPAGTVAEYWIVVAQEHGAYLWDVAVDRASALGGGPVGVDALGAVA